MLMSFDAARRRKTRQGAGELISVSLGQRNKKRGDAKACKRSSCPRAVVSEPGTKQFEQMDDVCAAFLQARFAAVAVGSDAHIREGRRVSFHARGLLV